MKKKHIPIFLLSSVMVLLLGYKILPHITPGVTIINKTDKIIYINVTQYAKEVKKAEELTDAELAQLKVHVPIQSQKARYFPASFSALVDSRVMNFHTGWDIGSRASTSNGGSHAFDLSRDKGTCQVDIEIYAELYKIVPKERIYCYKKLLPTLGRMIIHTEEKTIFNDYGPTTDKIEKQLIRFN